MGINLYDNPAQAKFINTYVPIQFENLYRVADKAQKNLDESEKLLDDTTLNYSSLNTMSEADKAKWDTEVYGVPRQFIETQFNSEQDMKDPYKQAQFKAIVRKLKNNPLTSALMTSAVNMREVAKNSDPRWGEYEKNKLRAWNTSDPNQGVFDGSNIKYEGWDKVEEDIFKGINPDGTYQKQLSNNEWEVMGTTEADVKGILGNAKEYLATHPFINAIVEKDFQDGNIPKSYYNTDAKGNIIVDPTTGQPSVDKFKYAEDQIYALAKKREHIERKYIGDKYRSGRASYSGGGGSYPDGPSSLTQEENALQAEQVQSNLRSKYLEEIGKHVVMVNGSPRVSTKGPLGQVGANYYIAVSNSTRFNNKVHILNNTLANTVDSNQREILKKNIAAAEKDLANARDSEARLRSSFDTQIKADADLHLYPTYIAGKRLMPALSADKIAEAHVVNASTSFPDKWMKENAGPGFQLKTARGVIATTYPVRNSKELTFVDKNKKLPMSSHGSSYDGAIESLNRVLANGDVSNKASFSPTAITIKYGDRSENYGNTYIDVNSAATAGLSTSDMNKLIKAGKISIQRVVTKPASGTGAEYGKEGNAERSIKYLVIPSTFRQDLPIESKGYNAAQTDIKNIKFESNKEWGGSTNAESK